MSVEEKDGAVTANEDRGFFHRYIGLPFEALILQGSSTRQLSYAVAIGVTFGLFPIMGVSIPFCFLAALVFTPFPETVDTVMVNGRIVVSTQRAHGQRSIRTGRGASRAGTQ